MTTGAALPVTGDALKLIITRIRRIFGDEQERYLALTRAGEADLAAQITRACIETGMAHRIVYADPPSSPMAPSRSSRRQPTQFGTRRPE